MIVYNNKIFQQGYTYLSEIDGVHSNMLMDFGILKIVAGATFKSCSDKECAFLLMNGSVEFQWDFCSKKAVRKSLLEESPHVLHIPAKKEIVLRAITDVEFCVQKIGNLTDFSPVFYEPNHIKSQCFGEGTMQDTSTRIVRTVFDADNAPYSGMVLGEVVNYPGKWSSYPPHVHPQPEIYHYRFPTAEVINDKKVGFGFGEVGGQVFKIRHQSTLMIPPMVTHPQTAAPGYPMYYLWMIPHLPHDKFGPDSRQFLPEYSWLLDKNATIWSD